MNLKEVAAKIKINRMTPDVRDMLVNDLTLLPSVSVSDLTGMGPSATYSYVRNTCVDTLHDGLNFRTIKIRWGSGFEYRVLNGVGEWVGNTYMSDIDQVSSVISIIEEHTHPYTAKEAFACIRKELGKGNVEGVLRALGVNQSTGHD